MPYIIKKSKPCPYLKTCKHRISKHYFTRICFSGAYKTCRHYAKRERKLEIPIVWLQKMAVEKAKTDGTMRQ